MHLIANKSTMRDLISFASFGQPAVVLIVDQYGNTQEQAVHINPWDNKIITEQGVFNLKIETDPTNPSNDVAWIWQ